MPAPASKKYDSTMVVTFPSISKELFKENMARGNSSIKAGAPLILSIVVVCFKATSQSSKVSRSRNVFACQIMSKSVFA
jgi:hypothetical protein